MSSRTDTTMQRLDAGFVRYLKARAKRERTTLVKLTRRMLAVVQPPPRKKVRRATD